MVIILTLAINVFPNFSHGMHQLLCYFVRLKWQKQFDHVVPRTEEGRQGRRCDAE